MASVFITKRVWMIFVFPFICDPFMVYAMEILIDNFIPQPAPT
jgi:hypothetical protein